MSRQRVTPGRTALALLLLACLSCRGAPEEVVLRVGHAPHDHHSPLYLAAALGPELGGSVHLRELEFRRLYELVRDGTAVARVEVNSSTGGKQLIRKLTEDQLDFAFGGFPAMLQAIDAGHPLRVVAPVMTGGVGLVVQKDLAADTWQEFLALARRGPERLQIGYKIALSVQNLVLEQGLEAARLPYTHDPDEDHAAPVVLVNLYGADNLLPALESGIIHGFVAMEPYLTQAEVSGHGKRITDFSSLPGDSGCDFPCCAVAARESFLAANRGPAEAFVAVILAATRLLTEDPERYAPIVASWLGTPVELERQSLCSIRFQPEAGPAWDRGVRTWVERLRSAGVLNGKLSGKIGDAELTEQLYDRNLMQRAAALP